MAVATTTSERADAQSPKGRPTPSRKEAEAQRSAARKIPTDPKQAKRAAKDRARAERSTAREGMMAGDPKFLPARDAGPVKAYIREYIDKRHRMSEYFVFIAIGILLAGFLREPGIQNVVSILWFVATAVIALELTWTLVTLNRELKEQWPEKADRKGSMFYGGMRAMQIRKLRVPKPASKA